MEAPTARRRDSASPDRRSDCEQTSRHRTHTLSPSLSRLAIRTCTHHPCATHSPPSLSPSASLRCFNADTPPLLTGMYALYIHSAMYSHLLRILLFRILLHARRDVCTCARDRVRRTLRAPHSSCTFPRLTSRLCSQSSVGAGAPQSAKLHSRPLEAAASASQ